MGKRADIGTIFCSPDIARFVLGGAVNTFRCPHDMATQAQRIEQVILCSNKIGPKLAYALARHGWGDSNGGFGVTYPTDLDEYDRHVDGIEIPDGFVMLYGFAFWPDGYEFLIPEADYLSNLARLLPPHLLEPHAEELATLIASLAPSV